MSVQYTTAEKRPLTTCCYRLPATAVVDAFHLPDAMVRPRVSAMLLAMLLLCVLVLVDIHVVGALCPVRCWDIKGTPEARRSQTLALHAPESFVKNSPSEPWRSPGPGPPSRAEESTAMARLSPGSADGDLRSLLKWAFGLSVG